MNRNRGLRQTRIRTLRPGEPIPAGEPHRYPNGRGYVRLRWKVGPAEYVEVYEHRLVAGLPAVEVHHLDGDKANNARDNLLPLDKRAHARHHGRRAALSSKRETEWGGLRSKSAFERNCRAIARKEQRRQFLREVAELYRSGLTAVDIAAQLGRDNSTISRALRAAGVVSRTRAGRNTDISSRTRQLVHARSRLSCERCERSLVWGGGQVHHRRPRAAGGSRREDTNRASNLLFLCHGCHAWIESNRHASLESGWLVLQSADPREEPVHIGHRWVWLTADGQYAAEPPEGVR